MIKKKTDYKGAITIDLTGPDGNAWVLLGLVERFGRGLDWKEDQIKAVQDRMRSGDYENLVKVFDECFGEFVILLR